MKNKKIKRKKAQGGLGNDGPSLTPSTPNNNWDTNNQQDYFIPGQVDPLAHMSLYGEPATNVQNPAVPITRTNPDGSVGFFKSVGTGKYKDNPYVNSFNALATGVTGVANIIQNNKLKNQENLDVLHSLEPTYFENTQSQGRGGPPAYSQYGGGSRKYVIVKRPYGGGPLTADGAKEILRDGTIHGRPLTEKQQKYFGWIAGGKKQAGGNSANQTQSQIISYVSDQLQQGVDPQQLTQQLIDQGIPQQQAVQIIRQVAQQLQDTQENQQEPMAQAGCDDCDQKKGGGNWIPKNLHKGRCKHPGDKNCPKGSPQYNLAMTFKKHHGFHKQAGGTLDTANTEVKRFAMARGLLIGQDAHVDQIPQYIDSRTGLPYKPMPVKPAAYTVPNDVQLSDIQGEGGDYGYNDPHSGNWVAVDRSVLNLPRFRNQVPQNNNSIVMKQAGGSIYKYLNSKGIDGSLANRKKLFGKNFKNYTGTAEQNIQLLNDIQSGKIALPGKGNLSAAADIANNTASPKKGSDSIQSGWVVDRSSGKMYPIQGGKAGKPINVITGKNPNGNYNPSGLREDQMTVNQQATVPGYYLLHPKQEGLTDFQKNIYKNMRTMEPISAFGLGKPNSSGETFYQTKGVHRGDFQNMDPLDYQDYMTTHGTHGCIGSDCDKPEDYERMNRVNPRSDTLGVFSSNTTMGRQMLQKYGVKQTGGSQAGPVNAEEGEIFQDGSGAIAKIADNAGTHEEGGFNVNASRVLEDTSDKRKDKASKLLLVSPEETEALFGFRPKRSVSHSKALELANEYYGKKRKKIKDNNKVINERPKIDKLAANSAKLNFNTLQDIPSKEDIFDALFMHQESVKNMHGIQDDGAIAKKGGKYKRKMYQAGGGDYTTTTNDLSTEPDLYGKGWRFIKRQGDKDFYKKPNGELVAVPGTNVPHNQLSNFTVDDILNQPKKYATFHRLMTGAPDDVKRQAAEQLLKKGIMPGQYVNKPGTDYGYVPLPGESTDPGTNPLGTVDTTQPGDTQPTASDKPLDASVNVNPKMIRQPQNNFYEPLYADELAPAVSGLVDSLNRDPELYNPVEFNQIKYKRLDPTAAMNANQADYNSAIDELGNMNIGSGAAAANISSLQGQKYAANNQVQSQYDNQNNQIANTEIGQNAQVKDRQSEINAQVRGNYYRNVQLSKEAQRQQRLKSIEDISRVIQMKRRQNRSGNLILKLSPAFNQYGEYNGYQYSPALPSDMGYDSPLPVVGGKASRNRKTITKTWADAAGQTHKEVSYE